MNILDMTSFIPFTQIKFQIQAEKISVFQRIDFLLRTSYTA